MEGDGADYYTEQKKIEAMVGKSSGANMKKVIKGKYYDAVGADSKSLTGGPSPDKSGNDRGGSDIYPPISVTPTASVTTPAPVVERPFPLTSPPINLADSGGFLAAPGALITTSSPIRLGHSGYVKIRTRRSVGRGCSRETEATGVTFIFLSAVLGLAAVMAYLINSVNIHFRNS